MGDTIRAPRTFTAWDTRQQMVMRQNGMLAKLLWVVGPLVAPRVGRMDALRSSASSRRKTLWFDWGGWHFVPSIPQALKVPLFDCILLFSVSVRKPTWVAFSIFR